MTTAAGEDLSIGLAWRTSMMGNSSRDPYWMASVRRETVDLPGAVDPMIAVHGEAATDADFSGGGDQVRYIATVGSAPGPFQVEAELWHQPVAHRWAMNLKAYGAMEPRRFVRYYEEMASGSGVVPARASAVQ